MRILVQSIIRLYLYGYTSLATKPPYKLQGFSIESARKQDKVYVSLIDGSTQSTFASSLYLLMAAHHLLMQNILKLHRMDLHLAIQITHYSMTVISRTGI